MLIFLPREKIGWITNCCIKAGNQRKLAINGTLPRDLFICTVCISYHDDAFVLQCRLNLPHWRLGLGSLYSMNKTEQRAAVPRRLRCGVPVNRLPCNNDTGDARPLVGEWNGTERGYASMNLPRPSSAIYLASSPYTCTRCPFLHRCRLLCTTRGGSKQFKLSGDSEKDIAREHSTAFFWPRLV